MPSSVRRTAHATANTVVATTPGTTPIPKKNTAGMR
jgi:hypothetical protein